MHFMLSPSYKTPTKYKIALYEILCPRTFHGAVESVEVIDNDNR